MTSKEADGGQKDVVSAPSSDLITRSDVPKNLDYPRYRDFLRYDFFYSCAYCTIGESEALTIHFTIDHYEPQRARPDLINEYGNLMYACNMCNVYKGSRTPTESQRKKGYRFFRPDEDVYAVHFRKAGRRLEHRTPVGYYSIYALNLNRQQLVRLRELRERLVQCEGFVLGGITSLRKIPLDQLPQELKGRAARSISRAMNIGRNITDSIDAFLRANAHADFADVDPDAKELAKERKAKLKHIDSLEPEMWKKAQET